MHVVHQVRNCSKYEIWKNRKQLCADLKHVYGAPSKAAAAYALEAFSTKWEGKYRYAITSWRSNWDNLTSYFEFPVEIRKIIYTTNTLKT